MNHCFFFHLNTVCSVISIWVLLEFFKNPFYYVCLCKMKGSYLSHETIEILNFRKINIIITTKTSTPSAGTVGCTPLGVESAVKILKISSIS